MIYTLHCSIVVQGIMIDGRKKSGMAAFLIFIGLAVFPASADNPIPDIALTSGERAWLREHSPVRLGGPRAFPPFHYFEEDGTLQGIASEYIDLLEQTLGLVVAVEADLPWPEVLRRAQQRELDVVACTAKTPDREEFLSFSDPFPSYPMVIINRRDSPFVGGLSDLYGKKIACISGVSTYEWLERDGVDFVPYFVGTPLEALQAVATGIADAYLGNLAASTYMIEKNGLANLKIAAPTPYGRYDLHFAVRKDWPEFVTIINKVLTAIPQERHSAIRNLWISVRYEHGLRALDVVKWVAVAVGAALAGFGLFYFWNRRLKSEIRVRLSTQAALRDACARYGAARWVA